MWCDAGPLRLSKIHGRVLTTLFNAIVCFPKGIELSISFVVLGKVTKQPFHHFDKNALQTLSDSDVLELRDPTDLLMKVRVEKSSKRLLRGVLGTQ